MLPVESNDPKEFKFVFRGGEGVLDLPGVGADCPEAPGHTEFISMWKPSEEEIAAINKGHPVLVRIMNDGRPIFPYAVCVAKYPDRILDITPRSESDINDEGTK